MSKRPLADATNGPTSKEARSEEARSDYYSDDDSLSDDDGAGFAPFAWTMSAAGADSDDEYDDGTCAITGVTQHARSMGADLWLREHALPELQHCRCPFRQNVARAAFQNPCPGIAQPSPRSNHLLLKESGGKSD